MVANGTVYVGSDSGKVFGVDEATGNLVWQAQVRGLGAPGALAAGGGVLVVAGSDGYPGISGFVSSTAGDAMISPATEPDGGLVPPQVIASGESGPQALALDPSYVYWTNYSSGEIRRASKVGGAPVTIASFPDTNPWGIAVDARNVYWTSPNVYAGTAASVMEMPLDGDAGGAIESNANDPLAVVAGSSDVFWTESTVVRYAPIAGGPAQTFATDANGVVDALAIDADNLYWISSSLWRQPLRGGPATAIGPRASAIAVDATDVYLAVNTDLQTGEILRVPVGGGAPTALATGRTGAVVAIGVDADTVYWIEGEGTIQQGALAAVPKAGGAAAVLASGLSDPTALAVDDSGVYFTSSGPSHVLRIPKIP